MILKQFLSASTLFITGDQAHSKSLAKMHINVRLNRKNCIMLPGAGHVDLYDRVELIPFDKLESFFKANLK